MSEIFHNLVEIDHFFLTWVHYVDSPNTTGLSLIKVTHVCRYWRRIALEDSGLWATVIYHLGQDWLHETVRRSRQAPLICRLPDTYGHAITQEWHREYIHSCIHNNLHRLRELRVYDHDLAVEFCESLKDSPTPQMKILDIRANVRFEPPPHFQPLHLGPLRILSVSGCNISWDRLRVSQMSCLREIKIANSRTAPKLSQLHSFLSLLPSLERLSLGPLVRFDFYRDDFHLAGELPAGETRVQLPNLQELRIEDETAVTFCKIQDILDPPRRCQLSFQEIMVTNADDISLMSTCLSDSLLRRAAIQPIINMEVVWAGCNIVFTVDKEVYESPQPDIHWEIGFSTMPRSCWDGSTMDILHAFPTATALRRLWLHPPIGSLSLAGIDIDDVIKALRNKNLAQRLDKVEHLILDIYNANTTDRLLRVLLLRSDDADPRNKSHPLPVLTKLSLRFNGWVMEWPARKDFWDILAYIANIMGQRQADAGICKLQRLELLGWDTVSKGRSQPEALLQLRDLVDKVVTTTHNDLIEPS